MIFFFFFLKMPLWHSRTLSRISLSLLLGICKYGSPLFQNDILKCKKHDGIYRIFLYTLHFSDMKNSQK